jgi:hypothetical protein
MSMFSICREIVAQGGLDESLKSQCDAEASFTSEIGVLDRHFFQCIQQDHVIWAITEWTTEKAHNDAAESIMKVRRDDRVASAYFRPGLYFELFGKPVEAACREWAAGDAGLVVVCHGLVADRAFDGWGERVMARLDALGSPEGLLRLDTYWNYDSKREFVAFMRWRDETAYVAARDAHDHTPEERVFVEPGDRSDLASFCQFECRPLIFEEAATDA